MIHMKSYKIILMFLFISLSIKGLSQQFDTKSLLLNECEITDTIFLNGLRTLVLSDSTYFNDRETYIFYLSFDSLKSAFGSNYVVALVPIEKSLANNSQGIFLIGNRFFLIDNSVSFDIFTFTGNKKKLFYKKIIQHHPQKNDKSIIGNVEEFSVWFLNYSDGIMSVTNKLYVY